MDLMDLVWGLIFSYWILGRQAPFVQPQKPEHILLDWVHAKGGWAHLTVEAINDEGLRGVTATVDVKEGESIAMLPTDLVIEMGSERHSSAENAAVLLGRQQKDQQWYESLVPYWTSLPQGNGSIFCRHLFTERETALLQSDSMAEEIRDDQEHLYGVYHGRAKWWQQALGLVPKANLVRELGKEHNVTLEAFAQTACLVGAYAFACQRGIWPFHYRAVCLLPLMDMLNHRRDGESNAVVDQNKNGSYSCYAKRDIRAGEEVTQTYSPATARADHSLLQYGFVEEVQKPLLAAVDSATGFDTEDDTWYGMHQQLIGPEESERLMGILEGLQSSEKDDAKLLNVAKREGDVRLIAIMQFRLQRRRALQQMIERLQKGHASNSARVRSQQEL